MASALEKKGYKIMGKSRQILPGDLEAFDMIVTMDETNFSDVRELDPTGTHHPKVRTLVSFCRNHDDPRVPDPYYGGQAGFDHVIRMLEDGCGGILAEFPQGVSE